MMTFFSSYYAQFYLGGWGVHISDNIHMIFKTKEKIIVCLECTEDFGIIKDKYLLHLGVGKYFLFLCLILDRHNVMPVC